MTHSVICRSYVTGLELWIRLGKQVYKQRQKQTVKGGLKVIAMYNAVCCSKSMVQWCHRNLWIVRNKQTNSNNPFLRTSTTTHHYRSENIIQISSVETCKKLLGDDRIRIGITLYIKLHTFRYKRTSWKEKGLLGSSRFDTVCVIIIVIHSQGIWIVWSVYHNYHWNKFINVLKFEKKNPSPEG